MPRRRPKPNGAEHEMVRNLDALAEFDKFQEEILPILRKALHEGWTSEKILNHPKAQAMLAARALTIGLTAADPAKAMTAIKDLMDRTTGKPTEKREVKHQFEKLSDDELDALLTTADSDDE